MKRAFTIAWATVGLYIYILGHCVKFHVRARQYSLKELEQNWFKVLLFGCGFVILCYLDLRVGFPFYTMFSYMFI